MKNTKYSRVLTVVAAVFIIGSLVLMVHNIQAGETTSTIVEIDGSGSAGIGTAVAVNSSGQIIIGYFDATNLDLKVAVCEDKKCPSPAIETIDSAGDVGVTPSIAITADDRPVISYFDLSNSDLKLAVCNDPYCTSAITKVIDAPGLVGINSSIALDEAGRPIISYYDGTNQQLKLASCNDPTCSNPDLVVVDSTNNPGQYSSLTLDENGLAVIAYYEEINEDLKIAFCDDTACNLPKIKNIDTTNDAGRYPSLEVVSGTVFISYLQSSGSGDDVKIARCNDTDCNNISILDLIEMQDAHYTSMVMNDKGELFVTLWDAAMGDLIVAACIPDPVIDCAGATFTRLDHHFSTLTGLYPDIALDEDGTPVVTYYDQGYDSLTLASCPLCRVPTRTDIGPAGLQDSISLVLTKEGFPIMTYQNAADNNFYLVFCSDTICSEKKEVSLGTGLHLNPSLALQPNGRPAVAYNYAATNELRLTFCNNESCYDRTTQVISTDAIDPSLQFKSDGFPILSYYRTTYEELNLANCFDSACTSMQKEIVDSTGKVGRHSSMGLTPEDYPVISYYDETNNQIKRAVCDDTLCSNPDIKMVQVTQGPYNDLAISENGTVHIASYDNGIGWLSDSFCDLPCNGLGGSQAVDTTASDLGWDISIAIGQNGFPLISYYDNESGVLRMAVCINTTCERATLSVVDAMGSTNGRFSAIALNERGQPVIAHVNMTFPSARIVVYDPVPTFKAYAPVIINQ